VIPSEELVLAMAATLSTAVFVGRTRGTLTPRMGALLLDLALLAAAAAVLHMEAW
jgi:hypothetical protein